MACAIVNSMRYSLLIPTFNGATHLPALFAALAGQDLQPGEILVYDSGSTDDTVAICEDAGARVVHIRAEDFDHGGTRTAMAKMAKADNLVYLTQDAIPANNKALSILLDALDGAKEVWCAYGRQLPHEDASYYAAHLRGFNYPSRGAKRSFAQRLDYGLKTIFISNSFAAYKKSALERVGFFKNGLIFGEDTCSLARMLMAGGYVVYEAEALVYHSHNYSYGGEFKRSFDIGVLHDREGWLLENFGVAEDVGKRYVGSVLAKSLAQKNPLFFLDSLVRSGFKFLGYKAGRNHRKIPFGLQPKLSLNSRWWQKDSYS